MLEMIHATEKGEVLVREFGVGLNPFLGRNKVVSEPNAFERQRGLHISLGKKHNLFRKPNLRKKDGVCHVDCFVDLYSITAHGVPSQTGNTADSNTMNDESGKVESSDYPLYYDGDYHVDGLKTCD